MREAKQLAKERTQLAEVVSRASMLEITDFQMIPLNKRDRKATRYNQILKAEKLQCRNLFVKALA